MSPMDMAMITDELEFTGNLGGESPPSTPVAPTSGEEVGEKVETGIPYTWIAIGAIGLIIIIVSLKFKPAAKFIP